ncbi:MAG: glycosyltransferase family 4 protein [Phycisphaerae bacterium]
MGKPRICFLVGGREGGGAARSTLQLIKGIDRGSYDVSVAACGAGPYTEQIIGSGLECDILGTGWPPMMRQPTETGARLRWMGYAWLPYWVLATTHSMVRYVTAKRIDVIHTNYHHFHLIGGLTCVLTRRRCVWHWRGAIRAASRRNGALGASLHTEAPRDLRWTIIAKAGWLLRRIMGRRVWSIANSRMTGNSIRQLVGDRFSVVYNGIECTPLPGRRRALNEILGLPTGTRVVGLVGSLHPLKGQAYFLEAAARVCRHHHNVHFVCIGGQTAARQQDYEASLLARRAALRLEDRVTFMGPRPDAAVLVADFDIATVCTLPPGEGFGLVTVEAMARSVPVISSDEGAAREIIVDGETGVLVPAADSAALAEAIEKLLTNESQRRRMGERGFDRCRLKFDIRKTIRQVEDVYGRLLDR